MTLLNYIINLMKDACNGKASSKTNRVVYEHAILSEI